MSFGGNEESERAMKMLQQLAFPGITVRHEPIGMACRGRAICCS